MAAIPLQGFAAASMLFCAAAGHDVVQSAQAIASVHDGHAGHEHAADSAANQVQGSDALRDATHQCGLCASCCHSVAITEIPAVVALATAPQAELAGPFKPMPNRASPVPDRPPRA